MLLLLLLLLLLGLLRKQPLDGIGSVECAAPGVFICPPRVALEVLLCPQLVAPQVPRAQLTHIQCQGVRVCHGMLVHHRLCRKPKACTEA